MQVREQLGIFIGGVYPLFRIEQGKHYDEIIKTQTDILQVQAVPGHGGICARFTHPAPGRFWIA